MSKDTDKIRCTVGVLTFNNGATLRRALESVRDFDEILICDGGSTDVTLAIAHEFGARIIEQDAKYKNQNGSLRDYSGVRNQMLNAASNNWFFVLDSDEYIGPELANEISVKIAGAPAAYWVPRKYIYCGVSIDCSVAYPSQQMRLFHRGAAKKFIKEVHERIELMPGVAPGWLTEPMFVPLPDTAAEMIAKWRGYLAIENTRRKPISLRQWIRPVLRDVGIAGLYLLRLINITLFCRGTRLPTSYELARMWYQWALIRDSFMSVEKI